MRELRILMNPQAGIYGTDIPTVYQQLNMNNIVEHYNSTFLMFIPSVWGLWETDESLLLTQLWWTDELIYFMGRRLTRLHPGQPFM